jgi:hypothetical protein
MNLATRGFLEAEPQQLAADPDHSRAAFLTVRHLQIEGN